MRAKRMVMAMGGAILALLTGHLVLAQTQTVGLFINDARAWSGYTLFAPKHYGSTYLIDNQGKLVHAWTGSRYEPGSRSTCWKTAICCARAW